MTPNPDMLLWLAPVLFLAASLLAMLMKARAWTMASVTALAALASTLGAVVWAAVQAVGEGRWPDTLGMVMATLIALLGWVIVRYSRRYLDGEPGQVRYVAALLLTLSSVGVVVLTGHLGVMVVAWTASSIGLHHLLTFYPDRAPAQIVAHKKFLVSRMAEVCLLTALVLIGRETGTLTFDGIATHLAGLASIPVTLHIAAVLIALAVILKSAQLPLHGWLIQVMEAPTPVSALLHAGIVNIGGVVLIRLADLMTAAPAAQAVLVVIGSLTAVLAGLVMMTRISIKVRLAWSTCAQMGFMLMECGLGLYELAFLHLVAHSLYKAHAFLSAGETVSDARERDLAPKHGRQSVKAMLSSRIAALPISLALVAASLHVWQQFVPALEIQGIALAIIAIGLAPLMWLSGTAGGRELVRGAARSLALVQLYIVWHIVFGALVPPSEATSPVLAAWVGACFLALYGAQVWLLAFPRGAFSARLYPWAYAGFYLDERFTRLTFRVWPARMSNAGPAIASARLTTVSGAQA